MASSAPSPRSGRAKLFFFKQKTAYEMSGKRSSSLSLLSTEALARTRPQLRERRSNMGFSLWKSCLSVGLQGLLCTRNANEDRHFQRERRQRPAAAAHRMAGGEESRRRMPPGDQDHRLEMPRDRDRAGGLPIGLARAALAPW